jgi:isocitrate lyase
MLAYVKGFKDKKFAKVLHVKHQRMAGSNLGDDHKTFFAGDKALKADGAKKQVISLKVKKCYRTRTSIRK